MWCNLVEAKCKQGFLERKHAALNIWKAVLRLDWTELCLALGFSVDPAGVGPTELVCFRLLCSSCLTCFTVDRMICLGLKRLFSELDWTAVTWLCRHFYFGFRAWFGSLCVVLANCVLGEFLELWQYLLSVTEFLTVISAFPRM